jgi:hypothetical protein
MKEELDRIFSIWVRINTSDYNGFVECCYCGKIVHWRESENCHYIDRRHIVSRWDEINCNPGHAKCNRINDRLKYRSFLIKKHGELSVLKLEQRKHMVCRLMSHELEEMIERYKSEILVLSKQKGLAL